MASTTVLITGGNRGLGEGLVRRFLAEPNHTVIAAVRDPSHPTAQALANLDRGPGSALITVPYDAASEQGAADAVAKLRAEHGIAHLDIVVANAAIATAWPLVKDAKRADLLEHYKVNVLGVVSLYQATRDLLQQSPAKPVFVLIGSQAGSLGRNPPVPNGLYGPTKTMLNWYGVRINAEDEWLTAFILDPGWVQTEMGNGAARAWGMGGTAPLELRESVDGMFKVITTATKETHGGKLVQYTGEVSEW
ncbi:hypothetical protein VTH06DRAFT_5040 [Thermothelomyces fergusii]